MQPRSLGLGAWLVVGLMAATGSSRAQGQQSGGRSAGAATAAVSPRGLEAFGVRTPRGRARFYVMDPEAPVSVAWQDGALLAGKDGQIPEPIAGFEFTNRVLVRTDRPERIQAIARAFPGVVVRPMPAARGYWTLRARSVREAVQIADELESSKEFAEVSLDLARPRALREVPTDPFFPSQWHLKNDLDPLFDVNVEPAWTAGYTGAGVVIGIVERPWQHDHPDLADHYNAAASQAGGSVSSHATSVAGIAGAVANNDLFGVGAAYGADLSTQLYGSDSEIADAMGYRNDLNDIKSNSWGPLDVGKIYYLPAVVRTAIEQSVATGRGGLGEVFVWAGGNGWPNGDRVDYDPYASSRFTIAVGAIGDLDLHSGYSEEGSSLVVVTQSNGNVRSIGTTSSGGGWTSSFGGTSATAPLAAGVVALMLEANPGLTWRDVQHVLIDSARKCDPNDADWTVNGAGYAVNHKFGFGAVDAGAAVSLAESWENVPHEVVVDTGVVDVNVVVPDPDPNGVFETISVSDNIRIETVELILNVQTTFVGDLQVVLTGPSGTRSVLARRRPSDPQDNFVDYPFTSFRHWGEESAGDWTIQIADRAPGDTATWLNYRLVFHGTPVCLGDMSGDGMIGVLDLIALLTGYRTCEGDEWFEPAADFNNDGCIDISDLGYLLSIYGTSCP